MKFFIISLLFALALASPLPEGSDANDNEDLTKDKDIDCLENNYKQLSESISIVKNYTRCLENVRGYEADIKKIETAINKSQAELDTITKNSPEEARRAVLSDMIRSTIKIQGMTRDLQKKVSNEVNDDGVKKCVKNSADYAIDRSVKTMDCPLN